MYPESDLRQLHVVVVNDVHDTAASSILVV